MLVEKAVVMCYVVLGNTSSQKIMIQAMLALKDGRFSLCVVKFDILISPNRKDESHLI